MKPAILILIAVMFAGPSGPAAAMGDPEKGAKVFRKCKSCHDISPEEKVKTGPPLYDLIGRQAGTTPGMVFSKVMRDAGESGLKWTVEALDAFLAKPKKFMPGTRMNFAGLRKEKDRANLIAFLQEQGAAADAIADPVVAPDILALTGDREYGEYLSGTCATCHRLSGATDGIPSIIGWATQDFVTAMHAYRGKHRENPVMQQIAGPLSNEEIAALAAFFAEIKTDQ